MHNGESYYGTQHFDMFILVFSGLKKLCIFFLTLSDLLNQRSNNLVLLFLQHSLSFFQFPLQFISFFLMIDQCLFMRLFEGFIFCLCSREKFCKLPRILPILKDIDIPLYTFKVLLLNSHLDFQLLIFLFKIGKFRFP